MQDPQTTQFAAVAAIQEKRQELERQIFVLLNEFHQSTGVLPSAVEVHSLGYYDLARDREFPVLSRVEIRCEL